MSRFDLRWVTRHPARWIRLTWWNWIAAVMFAGHAVLMSFPVFDVTPIANEWPILMGLISGGLIVAAVAPLSQPVQWTVAVMIHGISVSRVLALLIAGASLDGGAQVIAWTLALHWLLIAHISVLWPRLSAAVSGRVAVESGRDDD